MSFLPNSSRRHNGIQYGCILLAAGSSSRMAGIDKLLLQINGQPLLEKIYRIYKDIELDPIVVTGFAHERLGALIKKQNAQFVYNPDFAQGHRKSVLRGLSALSGRDDAVIISLADMPLLSQTDIVALMDAYASRPNTCAVVIPKNERSRGNPVIIDTALINSIKEQGVDVRNFLDRHPHLIHWHESSSPGYYVDLDTRKDLETLHLVYGITTGHDSHGQS